MDAPTATAEPDALIFEATVKPHRSLSRRGVLILIGCMLAGSLTVTSLMALLGAWPVIGFNGADLLLAFLLLWLNIRAARAVEIITLSQASLTVTRTDIKGRRTRIRLAPYWLNPSLRERPGTVPRLILTARDTEVEIARQLGDSEKRDLAEALTRALHRWRNPRFDNSQLR